MDLRADGVQQLKLKPNTVLAVVVEVYNQPYAPDCSIATENGQVGTSGIVIQRESDDARLCAAKVHANGTLEDVNTLVANALDLKVATSPRAEYDPGDFKVIAPSDGAVVSQETIVAKGKGTPGHKVVRDISFAPDDSTVVGKDGTWTLETTVRPDEEELTFRESDAPEGYSTFDGPEITLRIINQVARTEPDTRGRAGNDGGYGIIEDADCSSGCTYYVQANKRVSVNYVDDEGRLQSEVLSAAQARSVWPVAEVYSSGFVAVNDETGDLDAKVRCQILSADEVLVEDESAGPYAIAGCNVGTRP